MVFVLPPAPTFAGQISEQIGQLASGLAQKYAQKKALAADDKILQELMNPNANRSAMQNIVLAQKLSPSRQKSLVEAYTEQFKAEQKGKADLDVQREKNKMNLDLLQGLEGGFQNPEASAYTQSLANEPTPQPTDEGSPLNQVPAPAPAITSVAPSQPTEQEVKNQDGMQMGVQGQANPGLQGSQGDVGRVSPAPAKERLQKIAALDGVPGRWAKEKLQDLRHKEDMDQKNLQSRIDYETQFSTPLIKEAYEEAKDFPRLDTSLQALESATDSRLFADYLADVTGIEPLRSVKGAQLATAGKEFYLGSLQRIAGRPNQYIEQIISTMFPKAGRKQEANKASLAILKADLDLRKERVRLIQDIAKHYRESQGWVPASINEEVDELLQPFAQKVQDKLAYDLRSLEEQEGGSKKLKFPEKVAKGTPLTLKMMSSLLERSNGDEQKALKLAEKLGFRIMPEEFYAGL